MSPLGHGPRAWVRAETLCAPPTWLGMWGTPLASPHLEQLKSPAPPLTPLSCMRLTPVTPPWTKPRDCHATEQGKRASLHWLPAAASCPTDERAAGRSVCLTASKGWCSHSATFVCPQESLACWEVCDSMPSFLALATTGISLPSPTKE